LNAKKSQGKFISIGVHHFSSNESLFTNERASSYRCNTKTSIKSFNTDKNVTITSVDIENLRIQPFVDDAQEFSDYAVGMYEIEI
jgi:hypothetical protein